jgi:hypothetical protein
MPNAGVGSTVYFYLFTRENVSAAILSCLMNKVRTEGGGAIDIKLCMWGKRPLYRPAHEGVPNAYT